MITILELANQLIKYDDDHKCRLCTKDEWGEDKHDADCPMAMAYQIINEAENKEE